jgi:hypothetical protein
MEDLRVGPLPGAELHWRDWLPTVAPQIKIDLMSPQHVELWEWIEHLEEGVRPEAFLADWPRAYGKTTTMRLAMVRMAVTLKRRFGLYVCGTQLSANNHIVSIRRRFERMGIGRAESKYGHALGWSGQTLRTENGFSLIALGLDTAALRGINLEDLRPDLIVGDDLDTLNESVLETDKKYGSLTSTVLQAGSPDCATLIGQNEIHANSIMHRLVSGEADALRRRRLSKVIAIDDFQYTMGPPERAGDPDVFVITSGKSTWLGKTIQQWEEELNLYGLYSFLCECQHELGAGTLFFPTFAPTVIIPTTGERRAWHICPMPDFASWWNSLASHDFGTRAAACSLISVTDPWGVMTVVGEEYLADRTSKQQALAYLLRCFELGLGDEPPARRDKKTPGGIIATDIDGSEKPVVNRPARVMFDYANTFPVMTENGTQSAIERQGEAPVEVWWRYGIQATRAVKDVISGLRDMNDILSKTVTYPKDHPTNPGHTVPMFRIAEGAAPMLEGYFLKARKNPKDARFAIAPPAYEHAGDAGRYHIHSRPHESIEPKPEDDKNLDPWIRERLGKDKKERTF